MNQDAKNFFVADSEWVSKYPNAKAGILVIKNIDNTSNSSQLDEIRVQIETKLRKDFQGFSRENINNLPVIQAYNNYYKNFGKSYHVRSQIESVINGKSLSSGFPALTAMFIAEVKNMLLSAGHDLSTLDLPIHIKIGSGQEKFIDIRGSEKSTIEGDMIMMDGKAVISSIILGPDSRTKLTLTAKDVLFAVYAPADIEKEIVLSHLKDIENYIQAFSPHSETHLLEVFEAHF